MASIVKRPGIPETFFYLFLYRFNVADFSYHSIPFGNHVLIIGTVCVGLHAFKDNNTFSKNLYDKINGSSFLKHCCWYARSLLLFFLFVRIQEVYPTLYEWFDLTIGFFLSVLSLSYYYFEEFPFQ